MKHEFLDIAGLKKRIDELEAENKKLSHLLREGVCGNDEDNQLEGLEFCDCMWCDERSKLLGEPIPPVGNV